MKKLLKEISTCEICKLHLPVPPKPVLSVSPLSKILIIGQAPGRKVHQSGIPWDDKSGAELRRWLGVSPEVFYDTSIFGVMPMGFCYPGKGRSGDLPPRPECALNWHHRVLPKLKNLRLTLLIGLYAQTYYLKDKARPTLSETVRNFKEYLPDYFPLAHPSPRNNIWKKKNPWFEEEVIPQLKELVHRII
jgi:uracil-DNA glycosylase